MRSAHATRRLSRHDVEHADLVVGVSNEENVAVVLPCETQGTVLDAVAVGDGLWQVVGDERLGDDL